MDGLPFRTGELGRIPRKVKNRLALSLNPPVGGVSGNWEDLADELGYSQRVISNLKMRHKDSPFHGLLTLWGGDRRHASLARLLYSLDAIERKDCVCILVECLASAMPRKFACPRDGRRVNRSFVQDNETPCAVPVRVCPTVHSGRPRCTGDYAHTHFQFHGGRMLLLPKFSLFCR